jgi:hypothetical protein
MEGIVRQTWKENPEIDIIFVYTVNQASLNDVVAGITQNAIKNMELVANHYSVPSIHFGVKVQILIAIGDVVWRAPANVPVNPPVKLVSIANDVKVFRYSGRI